MTVRHINLTLQFRVQVILKNKDPKKVMRY